MTENTSKTVQIQTPKATQEVEQIDLRPLYPSVEYFDENGRPISCLRGLYELGDGGGEIVYSSIEREGYRNFIKKVRWKSLKELNNYDLTPEELELCDLNRPAIPRSEERAKGGHTTIWGETVPHTKVNAPLTQNRCLLYSASISSSIFPQLPRWTFRVLPSSREVAIQEKATSSLSKVRPLLSPILRPLSHL